jgi:hypothetical protein
MFKMFFKNWDGGVDWVPLAQDRDRCWAIVNSTLKFGFHKMKGIS